MQLVADTFPHNAYLRRIDKHATGDCPWCPAGTTETNMHIQCQCGKYADNCTAAHHAIARATLSAIKDLKSYKEWTIWYETPFQDLPFDFAWQDDDEAEEQRRRRPDGVAWNASTGSLYFLEFTRAWDEGENMEAAESTKQDQYLKAESAIRRSQEWKHRVLHVDTLPFVFGVRGSVNHATLRGNLTQLNVPDKQCDAVIACGIRAAVTEARQVCVAWRELRKTIPTAMGPYRRQDYTRRGVKKSAVAIPPKPYRQPTWRRDRGY